MLKFTGRLRTFCQVITLQPGEAQSSTSVTVNRMELRAH